MSWSWSAVVARRSSVRAAGSVQIRERLGIEQLAPAPLGRAARVAGRDRASGPRPALGERGVTVVHVGGDVVKEGASSRTGWLATFPRDGRRSRGSPPRRARRAAPAGRRRPRGLTVRLDEDREAAVARGNGEQVGGALALLPERRRVPGRRRGQQQGAGGVLAESRREQGTASQTGRRRAPRAHGFGKEQRLDRLNGISTSGGGCDAVVDQIVWTSVPELLADPRLEGERPRGWTRPPNGVSRTSRQSPSSARNRSTTIRPSVGRAPRRLALVLEIGDEVLGRELSRS